MIVMICMVIMTVEELRLVTIQLWLLCSQVLNIILL